MAVVVVAEIEGGGQEMYEKVSSQAAPGNELPEGGQVHIAGPTDNGWRVITVWDTEEQFQAFRNEKLIPALQAAGEGDRVQPDITVQPVHNLITK